MNISIVIPVFNGNILLKRNLPSILEACRYYSFEKTELIIVDDASTDGTYEYLKSNFPFIKLMRNQTNRGFSFSANAGIFYCSNSVAVLLNDDVELSRDFLSFLCRHFENTEDIFAVRPGLKIMSSDKSANRPRIGGGFRWGFFDIPREAKKEAQFAFFAGGGASAYNKEKFIMLCGFDEIFSPFYFEDIDISYRAWKRGWKIIYEPKALAYHQGGETISKFYKNSYVNTIVERNKYFLVWKNITDKKMLFQHFIFIPARIIVSILRARLFPLIGLILALKKIDKVIKKRKAGKESAKIGDRDIFYVFKE